MMKLEAKPFNINVMQVYAPTQDHDGEEIEKFYQEIQNGIKYAKSDEVICIMGDLNAKVGDERYQNIVRMHGLGRRNERGDDWFGVTGKAVDWFKSYLTGACQRIRMGDCLSSKADLKFGVRQGSVLGPLLFMLYTTPLSSMIFEHAIPHHLYADDSQLYVSFASGDSAAALNGLQSCLASVQSWMSTNKLKVNPDKTEFLLIGNERQRN